MIRSQFVPASIALALLCNPSSRGANAQIVTEFDTSAGGFQITCGDPTSDDPSSQLPALCAFDQSYAKYSWLSDPGNDPISTGIVKFSSLAHAFAAENCREESCSFFCDDVCKCATGTIPTGLPFQPDGGSCAVLSSNPGTVPTAQPTEMPTAAPTFDPVTAILYNATDMVDPSVLRVRCGGNMPIPGSYCAELSGQLSLLIVDAETYGWTNCDQNKEDCVVSCSPDCICEVATLNDDGRGYNETVPTTPCEVIEPTPAPTSMPTIPPTSRSGSHKNAALSLIGLAIPCVAWMI